MVLMMTMMAFWTVMTVTVHAKTPYLTILASMIVNQY